MFFTTAIAVDLASPLVDFPFCCSGHSCMNSTHPSTHLLSVTFYQYLHTAEDRGLPVARRRCVVITAY